MLRRLSVRNVVLIDRVELAFEDGLGVLTGETGAGKSILLDALSLALGARADAALVRRGSDQAVVSAVFELPARHPSLDILVERGLGSAGEALILRRVVGADGRSRAYVNDQPVSVGLLRALGALLVEVQGQHEAQGLLNPASHLGFLDAFGGLSAAAVARAHRAWAEAGERLRAIEAESARLSAEEERLAAALDALDELDPRPGEASALASRRRLLQNAERLLTTLEEAREAIAGEGGADTAAQRAARLLERAAPHAGDRLDQAIGHIDAASAELGEAVHALQAVADDVEHDGGDVESIEARLFALRALARAHGVEADALAERVEALRAERAALDSAAARLDDAARSEARARRAYVEAAEALSSARQAAAAKLDAAVARELKPLMLEKARFETRVLRQDEPRWGRAGIDTVRFSVATNPGAPPQPIQKIASGGELARFLLALKVVNAGFGSPTTLVFDEVDTGIGGATASAVGARLVRLAGERQVLVVTHSPQVAALATHHWRIAKRAVGAVAVTEVDSLAAGERREEIARMLAGAEVTDEARAAAARLMAARA